MVSIKFLEQYFPKKNQPIFIDKFTFRITLHEDDSFFTINLKITQDDIPDEHLIKFRFGIGQHDSLEDSCHDGNKPHFEIETYVRREESIATTVYFTFKDDNDECILNYAKGTIVLINRIIYLFLERHDLDLSQINKVIYSDEVNEDLNSYEIELINALAESFKSNKLILRNGAEGVIIKTEHKLKECLSASELEPLLLPLIKSIRK